MKRVRVLIPFHMIATDTDHKVGDEITVSEEQLIKIQAVNVNMVLVLGEGEEPIEEPAPKKRKATKKPANK